MPVPGLSVEARRGLERVVIHFDPGDHDAGFALLQRVLPIIRALDREIRATLEEKTS